MITEALVILACTTNHGCSQTQSAYFTSHPETYEQVKHRTSQVKAFVGPEVVAASPILMLATKHKGTFRITRNIGLQLDTHSQSAVLKFTFSF